MGPSEPVYFKLPEISRARARGLDPGPFVCGWPVCILIMMPANAWSLRLRLLAADGLTLDRPGRQEFVTIMASSLQGSDQDEQSRRTNDDGGGAGS